MHLALCVWGWDEERAETRVSLVCSEEPEGGPFAWDGRVRHGPLGVAAGGPAAGGEGGRNRGGYLQTWGAWQTLGCECRCTVVSPSMGDSSGLSRQAQSWEQVWDADRGTVEALVGPAGGPLSPGCCKPETLLPASLPVPVGSLSFPSEQGS